jgi:hypothetical protein
MTVHHNNHAKGTFEIGQIKRPVYVPLSNNRNITTMQSIREAKILTIMQDPMTANDIKKKRCKSKIKYEDYLNKFIDLSKPII